MSIETLSPLVVPRNSSFPGSPDDGQLFWHTGFDALFIYDSDDTEWRCIGGYDVVKQSNAGLTLTTTAQDISNLSVTPPGTGLYRVVGIFNFYIDTAGAFVNASGLLNFDGSDQTTQADFFGQTATDRATVAMLWDINVTNAALPIKLRAKKGANFGAIRALNTQCKMWVRKV